jgi:hypothetical protein
MKSCNKLMLLEIYPVMVNKPTRGFQSLNQQPTSTVNQQPTTNINCQPTTIAKVDMKEFL